MTAMMAGTTAVRSRLASLPCDAAPGNVRGGQEVISYSGGSLTKSHYADVLRCLWTLKLIQLRN